MSKTITRRLFTGATITGALLPTVRAKPFGFEDCKYKLCNCEAESRGLDEQAHNLADLGATFIDRRVAENKPLDASEIKLITESYKQIVMNSRANRDLAQKVADTLAQPFLP